MSTTSTRDLLNHGAGKGDKPRSQFDTHWARRFDEIDWGAPDDLPVFVRKGGRLVKLY